MMAKASHSCGKEAEVEDYTGGLLKINREVLIGRIRSRANSMLTHATISTSVRATLSAA